MTGTMKVPPRILPVLLIEERREWPFISKVMMVYLVYSNSRLYRTMRAAR